MAEYQNGQVGLAVTDQNRATVADYMERSGAMGPRELAELRESGQGFLRMTIDPSTGRADAAQADFVSSVSKGNITSETEGRRTRLGDDYHRGDVAREGNERVFSESLQITDPNSMRPGLAETTLSNIVGDLTGRLDQREVYAVASAYASRLAAEGYTGTANSSESEQTQAGGGLTGNGALGRVMKSVGLNAAFTANNYSTDDRQAGENFVVTGFAARIAPNLADAQQAVYSQMGAPETWSPEQRMDAEREIAAQWAARNEESYRPSKTEW